MREIWHLGTPIELVYDSYLTSWQQYLGIDGVELSKKTAKFGIPQGSSLGHLIFLLHINDIPNCSDDC